MQPLELILTRLKQALGVTTDTALAKALGIKQGSISGAKKKGSIPPSWIIGVATDTGVSADWLLWGEGPKVASRGRAGAEPGGVAIPQLNQALLEASIEAVEEVLEDTDRTMRPDKKAELIAAIYELYADTEKSIDKPRVLRLVKSAL